MDYWTDEKSFFEILPNRQTKIANDHTKSKKSLQSKAGKNLFKDKTLLHEIQYNKASKTNTASNNIAKWQCRNEQ